MHDPIPTLPQNADFASYQAALELYDTKNEFLDTLKQVFRSLHLYSSLSSHFVLMWVYHSDVYSLITAGSTVSAIFDGLVYQDV